MGWELDGVILQMSTDNLVEEQYFRTTCNCDTSLTIGSEVTLEEWDYLATYDPTGMPQDYVATQSMGFINFKFRDHSPCADGFQFSRTQCNNLDSSIIDCIFR